VDLRAIVGCVELLYHTAVARYSEFMCAICSAGGMILSVRLLTY